MLLCNFPNNRSLSIENDIKGIIAQEISKDAIQKVCPIGNRSPRNGISLLVQHFLGCCPSHCRAWHFLWCSSLAVPGKFVCTLIMDHSLHSRLNGLCTFILIATIGWHCLQLGQDWCVWTTYETCRIVQVLPRRVCETAIRPTKKDSFIPEGHLFPEFVRVISWNGNDHLKSEYRNVSCWTNNCYIWGTNLEWCTCDNIFWGRGKKNSFILLLQW